MKTCGTSTKLVVSVAAQLPLGTSIVAFTQRSTPPVTRFRNDFEGATPGRSLCDRELGSR